MMFADRGLDRLAIDGVALADPCRGHCGEHECRVCGVLRVGGLSQVTSSQGAGWRTCSQTGFDSALSISLTSETMPS